VGNLSSDSTQNMRVVLPPGKRSSVDHFCYTWYDHARLWRQELSRGL